MPLKQSRGLDGPFIFTSASFAVYARIHAAGNSCAPHRNRQFVVGDGYVSRALEELPQPRAADDKMPAIAGRSSRRVYRQSPVIVHRAEFALPPGAAKSPFAILVE